MSIPPSWGNVGMKKWPQFLDTDTQSPIFGPLNMGTFCNFGQKCPYSGAQKCDFECRYPKTKATFSCQHSPKMVEWTFVSCVFHFWMRNQQILKKCTFWTVLSCFSLSTVPKIRMQCGLHIVEGHLHSLKTPQSSPTSWSAGARLT